MELVNKIRKEFKALNKVNPVAKKFNCSWATVNSIVHSNEEDFSKRGKRKKNTKVLNELVIKRINELLDEENSKNIHHKQRYKSPVIFKILKKEKIFNGCDRYLRKILKKILLERNSTQPKSYLELVFTKGSN
jgi:hypothetical protein